MLKPEGLDNIKGVLFDCYGTLIDIKTDEDSIETYRTISNWLIYQGIKIEPENLMDEYKGLIKEELAGRWEKYPEIKVELVFAKICKQYAIWKIDESALGKQTACTFRAASLRKIKEIESSMKLLKALEDTPMGIVSNSQRVFSEAELKYLGIMKYFRYVIFSSDFGHKKPDPRIFIEGANGLGLKPEDVLFIGDSMDNDIAPSTIVGMKAMQTEEAWKFFDVA